MSFQAQYGGQCGECDGRIEPGDDVEYVEGVLRHVVCPDDRPARVLGSLCASCGLIHPGEC